MKRYLQISEPTLNDPDPHPSLTIDGNPIHAGQSVKALFPEGWKHITIEMHWKITGPKCWYISTPGLKHVSPIGLFVEWEY